MPYTVQSRDLRGFLEVGVWLGAHMGCTLDGVSRQLVKRNNRWITRWKIDRLSAFAAWAQ